MKKDLILSFLPWLLAELVFIVMFAFSGSAVAAVLFFALLLFSILSYPTCVFSGKYFSAAVKLPASMKKSASAEGTLVISNSSPFTFIKVLCCISAKNNMTGEREEQFIPVFCAAKSEAAASFSCSFKNCGYIEVRRRKYTSPTFSALFRSK